jgi:hypothetical protein
LGTPGGVLTAQENIRSKHPRRFERRSSPVENMEYRSLSGFKGRLKKDDQDFLLFGKPPLPIANRFFPRLKDF